MHKDLAKDGLVVISLSLDDPDESKDVLAFLKKQGADFPNFLLKDTDANKDAWEKRFPFMAPPIVHVFGKDGKLAKTFEGKKELEKLDAFIKEALKK